MSSPCPTELWPCLPVHCTFIETKPKVVGVLVQIFSKNDNNPSVYTPTTVKDKVRLLRPLMSPYVICRVFQIILKAQVSYKPIRFLSSKKYHRNNQIRSGLFLVMSLPVIWIQTFLEVIVLNAHIHRGMEKKQRERESHTKAQPTHQRYTGHLGHFLLPRSLWKRSGTVKH